MVPETSVLGLLVQLVDQIPLSPPPLARGRPTVYPDRLFLKALVTMIVRHLPKVGSLLAVLDEPTPEMQRLRALLTKDGHDPSRRTFARRLRAIPETLPAQIGGSGRSLVEVIVPWPGGSTAAIDSTLLRALGGVGHKKDREKGAVPQRSIDTDAHGTMSGWHGGVDGGKLHLVTTVAAVWIPRAAKVTPANAADTVPALSLVADLPGVIRCLLGGRPL